MLIKNLDYLSIPKEFSKVEQQIYENYILHIVYIENKGYSTILTENEDIISIYLLKTKLNPQEIVNSIDREDFIKVIKELLDIIYKGTDIKEYEKQHQEHVFLKSMDMFSENLDVKFISKENSKLYEIIEKGLIKLEIDIINNKIESLNSIITDLSNNLDATATIIEEKDWGNRLKNVLEK